MKRSAPLLLLVLSGIIISIAMGLRQSLGIFMRPMTLELGFSAATFGFSIALQNIVYGVAQPFVGAIADKHGARPVVIATAAAYAAGLALMAFATAFPGALQVAGFLTGIGASGTALGVLIGAVTRATPPERRTQTVGLVAAMGSLGTMVLAPLGQWLINSFGWHVAMLGFTGIAATMALLCLPIRESKSVPTKAKAQNVGDALREALGHRGYVFMTLAFFACGFQLVFITTHLAAYLQFCGVAPGVSATALGLIGLCNAIGTYAFGHLGARYSQKHLLALIYLARTLIIIVFLAAPISAASTLVFAAAMGFLWLGVAPLITGVVGRVFGLTHFNMLYGMVFLSHQLGSFFGAWMGGLVFDRFGNYNFAWGALIVIGLTAFTLQWLMDERPPRQRAGTPAAVPA
ncbi:MAG TPA: MFS transporter [Burkholderiales bacterium]|jgi:predicted MFS family arabinose efflux permease|nr:MFS transporter [Burkholderiales bacterium]